MQKYQISVGAPSCLTSKSSKERRRERERERKIYRERKRERERERERVLKSDANLKLLKRFC